MEMEFYERLKSLKEESTRELPEEKKEVMKNFFENLIKSGIEESGLKKGDKIPKHSLIDAFGNEVNIEKYFGKGPVIISFYRGSWCPYCNLELNELSKIVKRLKWLKGKLVAISPELPDSTLSFKEKLAIEYDVLSDLNNEFARKFSIVFKLDSSMVSMYKEFGIDLIKSNGVDTYELPIPASFIFDKNGILMYSFVKADYTERIAPEILIEKVEKVIKEENNA